jgi:transcriptional regulator with XRE-family HTH domain
VGTAERRARARAIWAYSGLTQPDLADASGVDYNRLRAILGQSKDTEVSTDELLKLAQAAGIPRAFVLDGWQPLQAGHDQEQRLLDLEEAVRRLVAAARVPGLAGGLGRRLQVPAPKPQGRRGPRSNGVADGSEGGA